MYLRSHPRPFWQEGGGLDTEIRRGLVAERLYGADKSVQARSVRVHAAPRAGFRERPGAEAGGLGPVQMHHSLAGQECQTSQVRCVWGYPCHLQRPFVQHWMHVIAPVRTLHPPTSLSRALPPSSPDYLSHLFMISLGATVRAAAWHARP